MAQLDALLRQLKDKAGSDLHLAAGLEPRVTDSNGDRIDFGRASIRYFGKIVSHIIFMIGYVMAGITPKKQALHDIMANCLVVRG